jgi:hypothetical protein
MFVKTAAAPGDAVGEGRTDVPIALSLNVAAVNPFLEQ